MQFHLQVISRCFDCETRYEGLLIISKDSSHAASFRMEYGWIFQSKKRRIICPECIAGSNGKIMKKTPQQLRAIFGLANRRGLEKPEIELLASEVTGNHGQRLSALTFSQANQLIVRLGGEPFSEKETPRRTINYRKQRDGVITLASQKSLKLMDQLAAGRGITAEGLERMCRRMFGSPRPRTAKACSAVIEALKSMNRRDQMRAKLQDKDPKEAA